MTTQDVEADSLAQEIRQLRADFSRMSDTFCRLTQHGGGEAVDKIEAVASRVWEGATSKMSSVTREIERKPIASALGAFGVGLLLGMIFSNRRV